MATAQLSLPPVRLVGLAALAMLAFAANSLLCRAALRQTGFDAASFTSLRIGSGALVLWLLVTWLDRRRSSGTSPLKILNHGNWVSAAALFVYAGAFSFAYLQLSAATGALLLFGAVQMTMIGYGFFRGERLQILQSLGVFLALVGLVLLLLPGLTAPPLVASVLMLASGIAWGIYSLRGRGITHAGAATAGNFIRALPLALGLSLLMLQHASLTSSGVVYALLSGGLASGGGYILWYAILPYFQAAQAATLQLSVPVITAIGGVLFLGEALTLRMTLASLAILGGIAMVILCKRR